MNNHRQDLAAIYSKLSEDLDQETAIMHSLYYPSLDAISKGAALPTPEEKSEHATRVTVLAIMRVGYTCEMLKTGQLEPLIPVEDDIVLAMHASSLGQFAPSLESLKANVLRLALACGASYSNTILEHWNNVYGSAPTLSKYSISIVNLLNSAANEYINRGDHVSAKNVLQELYSIAIECLKPNACRNVVHSIMMRIADEFPKEASEIANNSEHLFVDIKDDYSADFYWSFANALERVGDLDSAEECYEKCFIIRENIYRKDDWYTELSYSRLASCRYRLNGIMPNRTRLYHFIDNIIDGHFREISPVYLYEAAGFTLFLLLSDQSYITDLDVYDKYLSKYEKLCRQQESLSIPILNLRIPINLRGGFYLQCGDPILAERYFKEALLIKVDPDLPIILTDLHIKSNLLASYQLQNDINSAWPIMKELYNVIFDDSQEVFSTKDKLRILAISEATFAQSGDILDQDDVDEMESFFDDHVFDSYFIDIDNYLPEEKAALLCFCSFILRIIQSNKLSPDKCAKYLSLLQSAGVNSITNQVNKAQQILLYYVRFLLAQSSGLYEKAERDIRRCITLLSESKLPSSNQANILQAAGSFLLAHSNSQEGLSLLRESLNQLSEAWHTQVRYLNDQRLSAVLEPTQFTFSFCYLSLRNVLTIEQGYGLLLQFKALASLAGHERNRILLSSPTIFSSSLLDNIHALQNRIGSMQSQYSTANSEYNLAELESQLRELENEFAIRFPETSNFAKISWRSLKEVLPDNCAILEFFCFPSTTNLQEIARRIETCNIYNIEIYIIVKQNGIVEMSRSTVNSGDTLLEESIVLTDILRHPTPHGLIEKERITSSLYRTLIAPIVGKLEGIETVYIAPDFSLINVPFELLKEGNGPTLEDNHTIIKIECARDLLYSKRRVEGEGDLIIGNPKYALNEREIERNIERTHDEQETRAIEQDPITKLFHITPLPFSGEEISRVAILCESMCYSGVFANKAKLLSSQGKRLIHIATHGQYLSGESDSLYPCQLLFAGAEDWMNSRNLSPVFGNGVVTADEISRMDLSSVELVVLSACFSGMNSISINKGFSGLVGAFAAAGARYVISHLWSADDFSAAVLMEDFYKCYLYEHMPPPQALRRAKKMLRNKTIAELKAQGWFSTARTLPLSTKQSRQIEKYERLNNDRRPFASESHWGGFACYQCNRVH